MPLARIITRSVGESEELARELRARGYTVETVSPEQISEIPADLEIKLQECSPEEALIKAGLVPDSNDLCVFIAPGVLSESRPIVEIPLIASAQELEGTTPRMERTQAASNSRHLEIEKSNPFALPEHLVSIPLVSSGTGEGLHSAVGQSEGPASEINRKNAEAEVYVYQDAVLSPLQRLRFARLRWPRFSMRIPRPSWHLPRWPLPRFSAPRVSLRLPRLTLPRLSWRLPRVTLPRPSSLVPGMKLRLPSFRMPQVWLRIPQVKVRIPDAKWRIARSQWRLYFRNSAALLAGMARLPRPSIRWRRPPSNAVFWDTAAAFAILAVCVMLVGGLVHRRAPLPADLVQRSATVDQKVPFARIKPAAHSASTDSKNGGTPVARPQLAAEKQRILPPKPAPSAPRPAIVSRSIRKPSAISVPRRRSTTAENDDGYVAEDVVVHYSKNGRQDVGSASGTKSGLSR